MVEVPGDCTFAGDVSSKETVLFFSMAFGTLTLRGFGDTSSKETVLFFGLAIGTSTLHGLPASKALILWAPVEVPAVRMAGGGIGTERGGRRPCGGRGC